MAWLATFVVSGTAAAFTATPASTAPSREFEAALADLRAANDAWQVNDREYRRQRDQAALGGTEAGDFAEFVAKLRRKVLVECERYRNAGGDPDAAGIDCGKIEEAASDAAPVAELPQLAPAATEAEKDAALDAELRAIEESIDSMLDSKQPVFSDTLATRGAGARGGASGTGGSGNAAGGSAGDGALGEGGDGSERGDGGFAGDGGETARGDDAGTGEGAGTKVADGAPGGVAEQGAYQGAGKTGTERAPPRRAASSVGGADDDALARQLREAAESEPDPVLKEKLWDEYRKYKGSLR